MKAAARDLGFVRVGVAAAGPSPHRQRYQEWLAAGRHGTMSYMARNVARRIDPRNTLAGACSVVVCALPYPDQVPFPADHEPERGKIARYARGRDYHKVMVPRLRSVAEWIRHADRWRTWYTVDTGPLLERDWAEAAGVGWIGKNGLVIDAELGSWFLLGVVVTDRDFAPDPPATDHCGTCRACLDACPTDAFVGPRSVDARRCISYLTIEHRGEIDATLAPRMERWIFGCDICQEVCPFNRRAGRPRPETLPDLEDRQLPNDRDSLLTLDAGSFVEAFAGTALMRPGLAGMQRNVKAALGHPAGSATAPS